MDNNDFLKYFIQEDIYQIDEALVKPESAGTSTGLQETQGHVATTPHKESATEANAEVAVSQSVQETFKPVNEILVLVYDEHHDVLAQDQMAYLAKILGAVGLSRDKVDMVNAFKSNIAAFSAYKRIISFAPQVDLPFTGLKKYAFEEREGSHVLLVDPVTTISASVELRKLLWASLKSGFGI